MKHKFGPYLAGTLAGAVNGLFGAGGGMLLLPVLEKTTDLEEYRAITAEIFHTLPLK